MAARDQESAPGVMEMVRRSSFLGLLRTLAEDAKVPVYVQGVAAVVGLPSDGTEVQDLYPSKTSTYSIFEAPPPI